MTLIEALITCIITSAVVSFVVSALFHRFTVNQVTLWLDGFFAKQRSIMQEFVKDIRQSLRRGKTDT